MATDEEIQNALLAIHSRLGNIEGKVNLVARAERERLIGELEAAFRRDPILGQIFLLADGDRSQAQVHDVLKANGIDTSQPTVSRRMDQLVLEYGVLESVDGSQRVLRPNKAAESILNLRRRVLKWLDAEGAVIPAEARIRAD